MVCLPLASSLPRPPQQMHHVSLPDLPRSSAHAEKEKPRPPSSLCPFPPQPQNTSLPTPPHQVSISEDCPPAPLEALASPSL